MKRYLSLLSIGFLITVLFMTHGNAQTLWTKDAQNPVLNVGLSDSWDDAWVSYPIVIHDDTQFIMYYTGWPDISPFGTKVGRATSSDGINWTREDTNPVITVGSESQWDDESVSSGPVIFNGSEYKMWYCGLDGTIYRSGLATSNDGIDWTKYADNPVLDVGESGQWDDNMVVMCSVTFDGIFYKTWYYGRETRTGIWRVGLATSVDGINWERYAGNPILDIGETGEWDDTDIANVSVLYNNGIYEMWYGASDGSVKRTGYATSEDGLTWQKDTLNNPILVPEANWESAGTEVGSVLFHNSMYKMWYNGETLSVGKIGYATAPVTRIEEYTHDHVVQNFQLKQNYPNPFNPKTVISWQLPKISHVDLSVYNILGQKLATLVLEKQRAGHHEILFNGENFPTGIYIYRIQANEWGDFKKMMLIK